MRWCKRAFQGICQSLHLNADWSPLLCGVAAPRRAAAPARVARLIRAGPDVGDDTWGKGQVGCAEDCWICFRLLTAASGLC